MDFLKIVVLNNSGNVGKSLICERLLQPRIPNSSIIKIETINADGSDDEKLSAKNTVEVRTQIDMTDICIVDVGASNIETFLNSLSKMTDTIEDIDLFIIPTTPKAKQLTDTVNTVLSLESLDIPTEKIRIIMNMYDSDFAVEKQYPLLFSDTSLSELCLDKMENQFVIPNTELFDLALEAELDYKNIVNDDNDYRALIRATKDKNERTNLSVKRTIKSLFKGFDLELDACFDKLAISCDWVFDNK
ncbi:transcriptional regulator [Photobacterium phosphoreum]|uniref:Transcriptional regulator n=1 Tax=Photobacterium phosphoreum TaxID=659 RepID=A0AAW4ZYG3_PHOPO|nr:StbB family protein [Photobacterium phosphoreum]MCD9492608.1 transcriptional regulator [Photobacterium phosphoreum]MCF2191827.1 transcriptional regulator [Photobacterium phosphoreum]MCF2303440.1 transcriptional regulator [Photobacterium phosphoreum]